MNRLIKFRGKVNGVWWYATPDQPWWSTFWTLADRETIGQFTGLYARYRREIYVDDILGYPSKARASVYFDAGSFKTLDTDGFRYHMEDSDFEHAEVVGNRHDNPDEVKQSGQIRTFP